MYRVSTISDNVRVPPQYFATELSSTIVHLLRDKYERRVDRDLGIVLSLWNVRDIGEGTVIPGDGASYHKVTFDVLSFMPEVNEVFEGDVSEVVDFGVFVRMGPLDGLVHLSQITNDFLSFDKKAQAFIGKESKKTLKKGDPVRAKISTVSLKGTITETRTGLTMRPEGLGKLEWIVKRQEKEKEPVKEKKEKEAGKEKKEGKG